MGRGDRPRYEDDYPPRGAVPTRRVIEEPVGRDDRHRADRVETRERPRVVDDIRSERPSRSDRERERPDRDERMDYAADNRMGPPRGDARANTAARIQDMPRERELPRETITAYRDPNTGQLRDARTHEFLDAQGRPIARPRDDYDDPMAMDRDDPPPPSGRRRERERDREPYDSRGAPRGRYDDDDDFGRGPARSGYNMNEYFVEGAGIEREVIQHDICRYLGNDATVRRYQKDGRDGYVVRAYRALTTAQLEDLRRDSASYRRQLDVGRRSGRGAGIYIMLLDEQGITVPGSYAEMRARDEHDAMDTDMMDFDPSDRHRAREEPPTRGAGRHAVPATSASGYPPEPTYAGYALGPGAGYGADTVPRGYAGNSTPPQGQPRQPGYPTSTYPSRTSSATAPTVPATMYQDPKTGKLVAVGSGYGAGYAPEPTRGGGRHAR